MNSADDLVRYLRDTFPMATSKQIGKIAASMLRIELEMRDLGATCQFEISPDHEGCEGSA